MSKIVIFILTFLLVYTNSFAQNSLPKGELLMLDWPDEENWKLGSSQENEQMVVIDLVRGDETVENWTEIVTMITYKGVKNKKVEEMKQVFYGHTKKICANAKLTELEKNNVASNPWIIFSIECGGFADGTGPESQVWFVIQGKDALYANQRALKVPEIPVQTKQKFLSFFKKAKLVYN